MNSRLMPASKAWELIQARKLATLRQAKVSPFFTWGEVFINRSDAQIMRVKAGHLQNASLLAARMEVVRGVLGHRSITVTSWWRDTASNEANGGATLSRHLTGDGIDFTVAGLSPQQVQRILDPIWLGGLGYGHTFTHLDQRPMKVRFNY